MVNLGFDQAAYNNYARGASTDAARDKRKSECEEIRKFISGELSKMVFNWLLVLRIDLKSAQMATYDGNRQAWKDVLTLPPEYVPAPSGSNNG
jgi:hypothetical protein